MFSTQMHNKLALSVNLYAFFAGDQNNVGGRTIYIVICVSLDANV